MHDSNITQFPNIIYCSMANTVFWREGCCVFLINILARDIKLDRIRDSVSKLGISSQKNSGLTYLPLNTYFELKYSNLHGLNLNFQDYHSLKINKFRPSPNPWIRQCLIVYVGLKCSKALIIVLVYMD